jgi:proteasome alpha subunit
MDQTHSQYDQDSTIFSPDGSLFQVEYAREAVKKGAPTIGLLFKDGVVLLAYSRLQSSLFEVDAMNKITPLFDNIGCTFVGLSADARHLIDYAIDEVIQNNLLYDEQIPIKILVENICAYKHMFTTYNGVRPFGVVLFIAGIDTTGPHLYATDPSGSFLGYKVICEGKQSQHILNHIEKKYHENLTRNQAILLAIDAIKKTMKKQFTLDDIEIAVIEHEKPFYKIEKKEVKSLVKQ